MAEDYTVKKGDCISSLAFERGLLWETVWNHPNNASLKSQRPDPNILQPGDIVHLPDKQPKTVDKPTEKRHPFVRKGVPAKLRLKILQDQLPEAPDQDQSQQALSQHFTGEDPDTSSTSEKQTPRANVPYVVVIDGKSTNGTTDGSGMVQLSIPPNAKSGRLTLDPGTLTETVINLNLGWLDPVENVSGVKQRLANLGFDCGDQSNDETPDFQAALEAYQESRGLEATGDLDDATRNQLKQEHGG
jgi:hypothetical protein